VSTSIAVSEGIHEIGLTVTSHKGKEHHSIQKVEAWLPGKLVVPNVFSPNSDDKNKCLDPTALSENIAVDKLFIYDGSGKELFESSGEQMCWDGNDRFGNPAPVGNYLWLVRFHDHSGKVIEQKGNLTLLRN